MISEFLFGVEVELMKDGEVWFADGIDWAGDIFGTDVHFGE